MYILSLKSSPISDPAILFYYNTTVISNCYIISLHIDLQIKLFFLFIRSALYMSKYTCHGTFLIFFLLSDLLGMYSFGLEETNLYSQAEKVARQVLKFSDILYI